MFTELFFELRRVGVPVSLNEYLTLMEVMKRGIPEYSIDNFYYASRATLVKDERHLDRFDQVFGHVFKGLEAPEGQEVKEIPEDWLRKLTEKYLTEEEKAKIEALGGWKELMDTLKKRLEEQEKRHQGGS
ncbi:MAG: VWA domain-containing protein, partial [Alphaproteobacteria bacterium]|nr:VWA domain-containing protein [Alphaproteobacteria bacterium]